MLAFRAHLPETIHEISDDRTEDGIHSHGTPAPLRAPRKGQKVEGGVGFKVQGVAVEDSLQIRTQCAASEAPGPYGRVQQRGGCGSRRCCCEWCQEATSVLIGSSFTDVYPINESTVLQQNRRLLLLLPHQLGATVRTQLPTRYIPKQQQSASVVRFS
jgi:hypothetical protein